MEEHGYDPDLLTNKEASVEQSVEVVRRGILTEMDGRDLARIVATEKANGVDAYTVSKEIGAVYRDDRHLHANFNARNFVSKLKDAFGDDIQFSQIILDYYWMPTGWLVTRWAKNLFQKTLPELVKENILTYPSTRGRTNKRKKIDMDEGVVYIPFCAHVCKELVGAIDILEHYYAITFVKKSDLPGHSLWKGTMDIDADLMQTRLGKRLDQEEIYCTFRPKDIYESMEDSHVTKPSVMRILMAIEDYDNIRMIRLKPLRQHEPPSVMKERLIKPEIGGFKGLNFDLQKAKKAKNSSPNGKSKGTEKQEKQKGALAKAEKSKKKTVATKSKPDTKPPAKRKAENQGSAKASKKARKNNPNEDVEVKKGPLYEDVEEIPLSALRKIPKITYFYPCPALDMETYTEPEEMSQQDQKLSKVPKRGRGRPKKQKPVPAEEHVELDDFRKPPTKAPSEQAPRQYLSYNPRCGNPHRKKEQPNPHRKKEQPKGPGSAVLGLCTIPFEDLRNLEVDLNKEVEGACCLFNLRNHDLKGVSRNLTGTQKLSTFRVTRVGIRCTS
jgi:hypothetical protein